MIEPTIIYCSDCGQPILNLFITNKSDRIKTVKACCPYCEGESLCMQISTISTATGISDRTKIIDIHVDNSGNLTYILGK